MTRTALALALALPGLAAAQEAPTDRISGKELVYGWGATYGLYVGGTTGYLIGEAMEESESAHVAQGIAPGALVGLGMGTTAAYLVGKDLEITPEEATMLWTGSGVGTFYGVQLGWAFIPTNADGAIERVHAAGLAGSMAGAGIAMASRAPSVESQLSFSLATGIGSLASAGVSDAAGLDLYQDQQLRAGINLIGSGAFGGVAALHAGLGGTMPNAGAWGLCLGHGAWIGGMSPYLFTDNPTPTQSFGGVRAGLGVGYAGALALAAAGNPDPRSVALQTVGIGSASALGAGIPLAIGEEGTAASVVAPMLAGGVAGQALGAAIAPRYDLSADDAYLLGTLGAWTAYQSAGWSAYATATNMQPTRALGYALTTGGAGTLLAMGIAPAIDVAPSGSAMLLSGGGWGTWYGGWGAQLADAEADDAWLMMLGSGNGVLLATAVAQGAGWNPSWRDVGLIDGMGLLGGAGGGLLGVIALYDEDDWDPMVGSILVGSTVGLGTGIVLSARDDNRRDRPRGGLPEVRLGKQRFRPSMTARPWMSEEGEPGVYGELRVDELGRR